MPKVSVILPNFNHEKFLNKRIKSILNQTFDDFELIILDDASTDDSLKIIDEYLSDSRITHVIKNNSNSGSTFVQWQKGIELAKGEYIWISESDDESDRKFLESCLQQFEKNTKLGVVFCSSTWIDENSKIIHQPSHEEEDCIWDGSSLIQNEFLIGNLIYNASSAVFKNELLKKVNFKKLADFKYAGDWMFWVLLIPNTLVMRLAKRLNLFRRHQNNISFKSDLEGLQFTEGIKITQHISKNFPVSFIKSRKAMLYWAKKMHETKVDDPIKVLAKMPLEIKFWHKILNL